MNIKQFLFILIVTLGFGSASIRAVPAEHVNKIIESVHIEGLSHLSEEKILKNPSLSMKTGQRLKDTALQKDVRTLYLMGDFKSIDVQTQLVYNQVQIVYTVEENPIINQIQFLDRTPFPTKKLIKQLKSKPGQVLNYATLESDKKELDHFLFQQGYTLSKVEDISLTPSNDLLISFFQPVIESISIEGLHRVRPFVVRREFTIREEDVFNVDQLNATRERLTRLGYFSSVSAPQFSEGFDPKAIRVTFEVQEKKTNHFDLGLEWEDNDILAFIQNKHYNTFLADSDMISGKVQVGATNSSLGLESYSVLYYQPWIFNWWPIAFSLEGWRTLKQEVLTSDRQNNTNQFKPTERIGAGAVLSYPLLDKHLQFQGRFKSESIQPENKNLSTSDTNYFSSYQINSFTLGINYASSFDRINPKSGTFLGFELERGGDFKAFTMPGLVFTRGAASVAQFIPIGSDNTLGLHMSGGAFSRASDIATFGRENFDIGGPYSLRGYPIYFRVNAKKFQFNTEFRHDVNKWLQLAAFYDLAAVESIGSGFKSDDYFSGYGAGVRFFSPFGPIRFDFGYGENLYIHFALGQMF